MATTETAPSEVPTVDADDLQAKAKRHLWMHFAQLAAFEDRDVPIIVRGEGCRIWDHTGTEYLDGLAGLFVVQAGHGRVELAEAAGRQAAQLAYYPVWGSAHPPAIELAARLAGLAPGDLNRVFFTTGGSEAVESAWKLARQYHRLRGEPGRYKAIARHMSYHGTTMGALAITGLAAYQEPFEPGVPGGVHVANTNAYRPEVDVDPNDAEAFAAVCAGAIEEAIIAEGPETVAAVFLEPVQNSGGCIPPPPGYFARVREICDRHGVLLVSDEVICAFGRLGTMFGCERYGYQPDLITVAKGLTSGYSPLGAVIATDRVAEPFLAEGASFVHGITFGGHPVSCAVALENLDLFEREGLVSRVATHEKVFAEALGTLRDLPVVGDVRGAGYFWALELLADPAEPSVRFDPAGAAELCARLAPAIAANGLRCRTIDRGDPVIQLSPPLIAGESEIEQIVTALRAALRAVV